MYPGSQSVDVSTDKSIFSFAFLKEDDTGENWGGGPTCYPKFRFNNVVRSLGDNGTVLVNEMGNGGRSDEYGGAVIPNVSVHVLTGVSEFNFFVEGYVFSLLVFLLVGDISDKLFGSGGGVGGWR